MRHPLVLIGAGHAHLLVLEALAQRAPQQPVVVISPTQEQTYSGRIPGWLAGAYADDQCRVNLRGHSRRPGVTWLGEAALGLSAQTGEVLLAQGRRQPYGLLSVACGSAAALGALEPLGERVIPAGSLGDFQLAWRAYLARAGGVGHLAVVGAGAAGVELALMAAARPDRQGPIYLVTGRRGLLPGFSPRARDLAARALARAEVLCLPGQARADAEGIWLGSDHWPLLGCIAATGPQAPSWLRNTDLALDDTGFIAVNAYGQSLSHPQVFAAGNVASHLAAPWAKSGVLAVRQGERLAQNLLRQLAGQPLRPFRPRRHHLYILATATGRALACYGPWAWEGPWLWRWKHWLDDRYLRRFACP